MVGRTNGQGLRIVAPDNDTLLDLEPMQGLWTEEQYFKLGRQQTIAGIHGRLS